MIIWPKKCSILSTFLLISILCSKPPVTCVTSYSETSLIDINGAASKFANPGITSGLNVSRSRS